jgi:branched-chain amino acid transport system ATP-binding protein
MDVVQDISDWVVVMAEGSIIAEGPPRSIGENTAVVDAYLGSSHAALTEEIREVIGDDESDPAGAVGDETNQGSADDV